MIELTEREARQLRDEIYRRADDLEEERSDGLAGELADALHFCASA